MYSIILLLLRVSTSESMIPRPYFQSTVYTFVLSSYIEEDWDTFIFLFCYIKLPSINQSSCSLNLFSA